MQDMAQEMESLRTKCQELQALLQAKEAEPVSSTKDFTMPYKIGAADLQEKEEPVGFPDSLRKFAYEKIVEGFGEKKSLGELAEFLRDQMRARLQGGNWLCFIVPTTSMHDIAWHYDSRTLQLGFSRDGVEYDLVLSQTQTLDFITFPVQSD